MNSLVTLVGFALGVLLLYVIGKDDVSYLDLFSLLGVGLLYLLVSVIKMNRK
jgi:hypothetical protein